MNKYLVIGVLLIMIAGIGIFVFSRSGTQKDESAVGDAAKEQNESIQMPKDNTDGKTGEEVLERATAVMGSYELYDAEKITLAESGKVVLFFHASWCPTCRALSSDIEKNIASIPVGTVILKVDYDQELELKKKYGVTVQHTLVQVDKDGTMINKWGGGATLEGLLSKIE